MYYQRDIESTLVKAARQFRVVVLTGARQTGKSTLLKHLFQSTHAYVSLDDIRNLKLVDQDPGLLFKKYRGPLILDEIQHAPKLLSLIKLKVDESQKRGQFLITGSQQFTMMRNLRESLAGRAALFQLLPMAITEGRPASRHYEFRALKGSYPELATSKAHDPERWYASYMSTYIERDVQPHYRLEKIAHFRDFVFLLAARASGILNYQSLSNDLGVSVSAIKLWVKILEASQVIYLLRPYHINLGSRIVKSPKVYFTDVGLVNYLIGNRSESAFWRGPKAGAFFENFVIQEVLKHYSNLGRVPPLYYYRTNNGLEVDLMIEESHGLVRPCEIKLTRAPDRSMAQAIERLKDLNRNKVTLLDGRLISPIKRPVAVHRNIRACSLQNFLSELDQSS